MQKSQQVVFKEKITNTFLKTVSAFANYSGGDIYFGVTDTGECVGIANASEFCLDVENKINESISPKPDFSFETNLKNDVIKLHVNPGLYKPYLYKGKAYKRSHTSTVEMDQIELKRMTLIGDNLYFDRLEYNKKNLSFDVLTEKFKKELNLLKFDSDNLRTLELITSEGKYTNAAGIVADTNNFPGIDIIKFKNNNINEISDRLRVSGKSIFVLFEEAIKMFTHYYQYELIDGIKRRRVYSISLVAFREVLINALIHRHWDNNLNIQISMFDDRVEILSPGGLPYELSREEYLNSHISNLRNPIIAGIFFRLHYIEMFGTGITRIKQEYKDSFTQPIFETNENSIKVVLPVMSSNDKILSDTENLILNHLNNVRRSTQELAKLTKLNKYKIIKALNSLIDKNIISRYGTGRNTKYGR